MVLTSLPPTKTVPPVVEILHYGCIANHMTHSSYTLSHFVKYSYPQFIDEETESEWLPKFFGTELRKVSGGNAKEWVVVSSLSSLSKPGILGSDFKF